MSTWVILAHWMMLTMLLPQANSLVNSLIADRRMNAVGLVVVDEVRLCPFQIQSLLFPVFYFFLLLVSSRVFGFFLSFVSLFPVLLPDLVA